MSMQDFDEAPEAEDSGIAGVIFALWDKRLALLLVATVCGLIGFTVASFQTKLYEASASAIFPNNMSGGVLGGLVAMTGGGGGNPSDSGSSSVPALGVQPARLPSLDYASNVMESRSSAQWIVNELGLDKKWGVTKDQAVKILRGTMNIQKMVRENKIVITYRSEDPKLATEIVEKILAAFEHYNETHVTTQAKAHRVFIEHRLELSTQELERMRKEFAQFEAQNGEAILQSQPTAAIATFQGLISSRTEALALYNEAEGFYDELRNVKVENARGLSSNSDYSDPDRDTGLDALRGSITEAQIKLQNLLLTRTDVHPEVIAARENLSRLQGLLEHRASQLATAYQSGHSADLVQARAKMEGARERLLAADQAIAQYKGVMSESPSVEFEFERRKQEFEIATSLNQSLKVELERSKIAEALDAARLEILDPPEAGVNPVYPRKLLTALACAVVGVLLTSGWIVVRYSLARKD